MTYYVKSPLWVQDMSGPPDQEREAEQIQEWERAQGYDPDPAPDFDAGQYPQDQRRQR